MKYAFTYFILCDIVYSGGNCMIYEFNINEEVYTKFSLALQLKNDIPDIIVEALLIEYTINTFAQETDTFSVVQVTKFSDKTSLITNLINFGESLKKRLTQAFKNPHQNSQIFKNEYTTSKPDSQITKYERQSDCPETYVTDFKNNTVQTQAIAIQIKKDTFEERYVKHQDLILNNLNEFTEDDTYIYNSIDKNNLLKLKNKDFIYCCLNILNDAKRFNDIELLTKSSICKERFDMNFSVLKKAPSIGSIDEGFFRDNAGNRRYYPAPIILGVNNRYIVCNDWYYNLKSSTRDTRTRFVNWVLK